jgi:hypothetical protein
LNQDFLIYLYHQKSNLDYVPTEDDGQGDEELGVGVQLIQEAIKLQDE